MVLNKGAICLAKDTGGAALSFVLVAAFVATALLEIVAFLEPVAFFALVDFLAPVVALEPAFFFTVAMSYLLDDQLKERL